MNFDLLDARAGVAILTCLVSPRNHAIFADIAFETAFVTLSTANYRSFLAKTGVANHAEQGGRLHDLGVNQRGEELLGGALGGLLDRQQIESLHVFDGHQGCRGGVCCHLEHWGALEDRGSRGGRDAYTHNRGGQALDVARRGGVHGGRQDWQRRRRAAVRGQRNREDHAIVRHVRPRTVCVSERERGHLSHHALPRVDQYKRN